jgi:ferredoxin-NADP reductase
MKRVLNRPKRPGSTVDAWSKIGGRSRWEAKAYDRAHEPVDMTQTVTVQSVESVGPDTVAITFDAPESFAGQPGQFVQLSATVDGEAEARFYTISSPDTDEEFEVTVGVDPDVADFSSWLAERDPGDELSMEGPYGDQFYDGEPAVRVVAGGPGVGPAVAIGERALENEAAVTIVYEDHDPAHEERLSTLAAGGATVKMLSPSDGEDSLTEALSDLESNEQVFVYGFAGFVERVRDAIEAAGGEPEDAKVENFG